MQPGAVVKWVGLLLALLALALLAWGAGELHYRNCINAAVATTRAEESNPYSGVGTGGVSRSRERAVAACSRLPF